MKIKFREIRFSDEQYVLLDHAIAFVDEDDGSKKTARQIYYRFIATDTLPESWVDEKYNAEHGLPPGTKNTLKNYKRLSNLLVDGRYAGIIDWEAIEDRLREPASQLEFTDLRHRVDSAIANYRLPRWRDQSHYVEIWVEKSALAGILAPLAHEHHVTLMVNRGYSSASAMYESAERFRSVADGYGKQPSILYVGDFDPSGEDMPRDIRARLIEFGADVEVVKVALTMEQIKKHKPPPNPAKVTDPRAKNFIRQHGARSWEVDALPSRELRRLITAAVKARVDDKVALARLLEEEEEGKERLRAALEGVE